MRAEYMLLLRAVVNLLIVKFDEIDCFLTPSIRGVEEMYERLLLPSLYFRLF